MSKKGKLIFRISIALNIILIAVVAWNYMKMNFVMDQVVLTEVQINLVELEGLIKYQMEDNWSNPNVVTAELRDILDGISLGITTGEQLGTISERDKVILTKLYHRLYQYPTDELYRLATVTEIDQKNFEELREILRDAGFGLNLQVGVEFEYFIEKAEKLEKNIEVPLNN
ncbi:hypothetical protein DZB84_16295 [Bacillus sp. HNG]|uniref:hypothetical protein n=1 Tax=Bacillus sp. HNG TaxID=2293325 RepID=UPI000E2EC6E6|nr:hypothetical protein [Bacillus sp. HNG]RFB13532.1 hypothetical protein DZB84_16295 [Bacillus sp. HNG]